MSTLPKGWEVVKLGEVVQHKKGKKPKVLTEIQELHFLPYVDIKAFEKNIIQKYAHESDGVLAQPEDTLMVWDGARSGLVGKGVKGLIGSTLSKLTPKLDGINRDYLHHYFVNQFNYINGNTKGTGIPHVDPAKLWDLDFPLPSLADQKRIADKLDSVLAKVDAAQALLDKIPTLLKRFRQSVLAAATSGELTKEWREENDVNEQAEESFTKIQKLKQGLLNSKQSKKDLEVVKIEDEKTPSSWNLVNLGGLASKVTDGEHKTPKRTDTGRYLLSARNVRDGYISLEKVDYVDDIEFEKLRKRCNPDKGDILISCSGSVGRVSLCDKDDEYVMVRSAALVKTDGMEQNNKYLMYALQSPNLQETIVKKSKSTAQSNLFLGPIKELPIPLPSSLEQIEIVTRIEELFEHANTVEKQYQAAKIRLDKLTQSILAKAFRGELVTVDDSDIEQVVSQVEGAL